MKNETLQKILIAIAWLSLNGLSVNKKRVQNYTKLSYVTVSRYFDDVLPSFFLLSDANDFDEKYVKKPIAKGFKICNQKYYLFT